MFGNGSILNKQFTLGKEERIKHRKLIESLFRQGKHFSVFPFKVFYIFPATLSSPLQAGFSASSRNFKKAVDRNRIKRITKEAYRLQKNELQDILRTNNNRLAVFFIYTDKQLPSFGVVKERVNIILQKLITIIHEIDSPRS